MRRLPRAFVPAALLSAVAQCNGAVVPRLSPDGECDYNAPFGSPEVVLGLREIGTERSWGEHGAALSTDELEIYYDKVNNDPGVRYTASLYTARRSHRGAEWSTPERLTGVRVDWWARNPQLSPDGLTLYFARYPANAGPSRYYLLRRASKDAPFNSAPVALPLVPDASRPFFSADGRSIYYNLPPAKDGTSAIVRREWDGTNWTGDAVEVLHDGTGPIVSPDELQIFSSNRWTSLAYASRRAVTEAFDQPRAVEEITGSPTWTSANGCRIYLVTTGTTVVVAQRGR
ncbi:MAG: PD40 domain-containing protein [Myxococcales bacterium]|nr:PD40 domain-containing protein [Myxococcales bacterium]